MYLLPENPASWSDDTKLGHVQPTCEALLPAPPDGSACRWSLLLLALLRHGVTERLDGRAKSQARRSNVGVIAVDAKAGSGYLQLCLLLSRFICEFGAPRVLSAWESFMRARDTTVQMIVPGSGCPKRLFVHNSRAYPPQPGKTRIARRFEQDAHRKTF